MCEIRKTLVEQCLDISLVIKWDDYSGDPEGRSIHWSELSVADVEETGTVAFRRRKAYNSDVPKEDFLDDTNLHREKPLLKGVGERGPN